MAVHVYVKERITVKKKVVNYFSYLALTAGSLLLFWAFYPVVSFEIYSRLFIPRDVVAPIPSSQVTSPLELTNSSMGAGSFFSSNLRDFTDASLWFPAKAKEGKAKNINLKEYSLSIPKLNIDNALVKVGGDDLSKSLIHYVANSEPGESGNVVIFGHSTLPQLYNPQDYKSIFTYLPSLNKGDKVLIEVGDLNFEYEIYEMFVVEPEDSVLAPKYNASYLTLITCVPPGTYWKRLVVRAKLTKFLTEL